MRDAAPANYTLASLVLGRREEPSVPDASEAERQRLR